MKDYKKLKKAGSIKWIVTPTGKIIQRSKWDADTGLPTASELYAFDIAVLDKEKAENSAKRGELDARDAEINEIIADAKKAK